MERLIGHRERPIPSLLRARGDVPDGVDAVFRRLLSKSPEARPQSLSEVIQQLERARTGGLGSGSVPPATAAPSRQRSPARNDDSADDSPSIYQVAAPAVPEQPARRPKPEPVSSVFVPAGRQAVNGARVLASGAG